MNLKKVITTRGLAGTLDFGILLTSGVWLHQHADAVRRECRCRRRLAPALFRSNTRTRGLVAIKSLDIVITYLGRLDTATTLTRAFLDTH